MGARIDFKVLGSVNVRRLRISHGTSFLVVMLCYFFA